jgi:hypothetical protein
METTQNDKAKWTFMVYLAGDNNLSSAGDNDLDEMRQVGSSDDVHIVVEFDNAGEHGTRRYHVQRDGENEEVVSLGETDSGDPNVLLDFVTWAAVTYPAERYALVLWNHGGGWKPSELDLIAQEVGARNYSAREASVRAATSLSRSFFRTSLQKVFELPTSLEREICSDDGTSHSLDTIELGKVLAAIQETLDQPLDLLGMDACLMNNVEVAYQAAPFVRYLAASEDLEPNDGWPYDTILQKLVDNPDMSTAEFGAVIVEDYLKSYEDYVASGQRNATQAAVDLSAISQLTGPLDTLGSLLVERMDRDLVSTLWWAQRRSANFNRRTLWDLLHFCQELQQQTGDDDLKTAAGDVVLALEKGLGHYVVAEAHGGNAVSHCGGVTIYLPNDGVSQFYGELEFAKDFAWADMLKVYNETI